MKALFSVLLSVCLTVSAFGEKLIEKEFEVSDGERLDIDLKSGGSIEIRGWDRDQVSIEVRFRNCDSKDFKFDLKRVRSGVEIRSRMKRDVNRSNITVRATVPNRFDLKLRSIGGGITIDGITGRISGHTAGGELHLSNLDGSIDLVTGGGAITLRDSRLDGDVTTGGGPVLVENVDGDIDASSGGGEVVYRNVRTPGRDYPKDLVHIRNAGGEINVDEAPAGADVRTGGGDIRIRSADEFVRAETGGGDIIIDAVDGWVRAGTGAGNIDVTIIGEDDEKDRDVSLWTGSGDITLIVPEDLSMDIDIELAYTRTYSDRCRIISDFDVQEERTRSWDHEHGNPRKYIYGEAILNGGENRIKIRAVNGNVTLKQR
jgi:DUF4097 and DUF4098 domain-containing protein YvlB